MTLVSTCFSVRNSGAIERFSVSLVDRCFSVGDSGAIVGSSDIS